MFASLALWAFLVGTHAEADCRADAVDYDPGECVGLASRLSRPPCTGLFTEVDPQACCMGPGHAEMGDERRGMFWYAVCEPTEDTGPSD